MQASFFIAANCTVGWKSAPAQRRQATNCRHNASTHHENKRRISERRVAGLLGLAFDADDGHKRITRGNNFLLAGGSEQTHGLMRDTIIQVNETRCPRPDLADVSADELRDLLNDAQP